ncbi:MAG TPA: hypothetical protein VFJ90_04225, partial [Candidatus Didemnitutus sp.]|nr:hypothetical protein [Candidatus Didemnitutus sp.]
MIYFCCEDRRRELIRPASQPLNGIDRLEVVDNEYNKPSKKALRQRELRVYFVKTPEDHAPYALLTALKGGQFSVGLGGGERIKAAAIAIDSATYDEVNEMLVVRVTPRGDFSRYTLTLRPKAGTGLLAGLDPRLAAVDFSFKVECPSDLDCRDTCDCAPERLVEPELDYLAKDYNSFRQLIFDRLALIAPDWQERNAADLGVTLVELMAYAGDYLSYRQDAIATEAYLGTARQRISLRRHARLLDYRMHEGCNARVWIQVRVKAGAPAGGVVLPRNKLLESAGGRLPTAGTCFATRCGDGVFLAADALHLQRRIDEWAPEVFEPMHDAFLHPQHNEFKFYTWAGQNCCLPKGATKATLAGDYPQLIPGLVLVFQEVLGPRTCNPADADPTKRQAVRLTKVIAGTTDPLTGVAVTEIEWSDADELAFPLCLSSQTDDGEQVPDVSVALGNILLADHGQTLTQGEDLGVVPEPSPWLAAVADADCDHCNRRSPEMPFPRYNPRLARAGVTQAEALDPDQLNLLDDPWLSGNSLARSPAGELITQDPRGALPAIRLFEGSSHAIWRPQSDLIGSEATSPEFVAEMDNDGRARIRFGDGVNGRRPGNGSGFTARYRLGNGAAGNVG